MLLDVSLENELKAIRSKSRKSTPGPGQESDATILRRILTTDGRHTQLNHLDADRLYTIDEIRKLCISYRLRFLDASRFANEIPKEAFDEIRKIQQSENIVLEGFKIIAPASMFHLIQKDKDPMLFLDLGQGWYYLIHRWGRDLKIWRKWLVYPLRSFETFLATLLTLALIGALLPSDSLMKGPYDTSALPIRVIFFFYLVIALSGLGALYGYSRMKDFSDKLWNSKYTL
ncbi:hypothetical protein [Schleiferia thermophila]|jgi:hypothetical protein|uniref:Uncharacterized protein n=1 Tax=Schleiferia thermophila TaxID=884107 RepID=A0A369A919_9FLAO|nr:hypothetical protein [Schleiferia thermophila]RCX04806.1 hypothetical protein DES35_10176 [Schleiferia thermophila]GCD79667.1 hypothetical protein JCM30197_09140 [Schleiferia thermophila]